jgi:hypothetical protein
MNTSGSSEREVALPASAFVALARALRMQGGPLAAIHGLHAAGYAAGESLSDLLLQSAHKQGPDLPEREFWRSLSRFLARKGWGTLTHRAPHPGVGLLISRDWAESDGNETSQPSCAFSVGLLSHLLTRVANGPVAVLEVSCRAAGRDTCTFAFGSEATIHDLYGLLLDGRGMEQALAEL